MAALFLVALGQAAASGLSFFGQMQAADLQQQLGETDSALAVANAKQLAADRTAQELEERRTFRRRLSAAEMLYANSGVLLTGTPARMLEQQAKADEVNIQEQNRRTLMRIQALKYGARVNLLASRFQAKTARLGAWSSLLAGSATAGATAYKGTL